MDWYRCGMRPLLHPSIGDITVSGILHALSDPVRAAIYAGLAASSSATTCSKFLQISDRDIPKSTLSQHFKVLREAGLIRSERRGVEMRNVSRCEELQRRFPGLIEAILSAHRSEARLRTVPAKRGRTVRKS
jgi:DNA-binding transcriptional ArsR family regulator